MKKLIGVLNQDGISLLEVLISISILILILISIMNIFPQMGFLNQQNETKLQGINTAKQILVEWQEDTEVINYLSNPIMYSKPAYLEEKDTYYISEATRDDEKVVVKIAKDSDLDASIAKSGPTKVHQIHVQLKNNKNVLVGESFGYLVLGE
ncbi:hypothetical protein [Bacillus marasmi]|uniref:hypothetical protein n=1 Tax=Bacillus marasmi TaxID=1926279 RepID=UPI0011CA6B3E|nr:hypothetical protein [Bacillus marasmi]